MINRVLGFLALTGTVLVFSLAGPDVTTASNCSRDHYNHNGSLMLITVCDGGHTVIEYENPRAGMRRQGVTPGTLLFQGTSGNGNQVSGNAYVFRRGCAPAGYWVSGRWSNNGRRLVMNGQAPVRSSNCSIRRHRNDRLVFTQ